MTSLNEHDSEFFLDYQIKAGFSGTNGSAVGPDTLEDWYSERIARDGVVKVALNSDIFFLFVYYYCYYYGYYYYYYSFFFQSSNPTPLLTVGRRSFRLLANLCTNIVRLWPCVFINSSCKGIGQQFVPSMAILLCLFHEFGLELRCRPRG